MEFIFVFAVVFFKVILINYFEVVEIIRAFGVYAFMDGKLLTLFFPHKCMGTVRASERKPEEWLDGFGTFSIYQVLPKRIELWGLNVKTDAEAKKNFALQTGQ